jgi:hypothetical protein
MNLYFVNGPDFCRPAVDNEPYNTYVLVAPDEMAARAMIEAAYPDFSIRLIERIQERPDDIEAYIVGSIFVRPGKLKA